MKKISEIEVFLLFRSVKNSVIIEAMLYLQSFLHVAFPKNIWLFLQTNFVNTKTTKQTGKNDVKILQKNKIQTELSLIF